MAYKDNSITTKSHQVQHRAQGGEKAPLAASSQIREIQGANAMHMAASHIVCGSKRFLSSPLHVICRVRVDTKKIDRPTHRPTTTFSSYYGREQNFNPPVRYHARQGCPPQPSRQAPTTHILPVATQKTGLNIITRPKGTAGVKHLIVANRIRIRTLYYDAYFS